MLLSADDWRSIVIEGAKAPHGMASFARFLTPHDAEDIRAFVIQESKKATASSGAPAKGAGAAG